MNMETPANMNKPKWLKELETQSWQAELLISGVTIWGLFSLPDLLTDWVERFSVNVVEFDAFFLYTILIYLLGGIYALTISFSVHFFLRALWIALLGLNSVYPEGIIIQPDFFLTEDYIRRIKEKHPDINLLMDKLDRAGSLMFSIAFAFVMLFISLSFVFFVLGIILKIINSFYPNIESYLIILVLVLYIVFFGPFSLLILIQKIKKTDSERYGELYFKYSEFLNKLVYNMFYEPMMYIYITLITNYKHKYKNIVMFGLIIVVLVFASAKIGSLQNLSNLTFNYFKFNQHKNILLYNNYRDMWVDDELIYTPSIQSKNINEPYLELFLPFVKREEEAMGKLYPKVRIRGDLHTRDSLINVQLSNYQKFNKIMINDFHYQNFEFDKIVMGNRSTEGLIAYLPLDQMNEGKNTLIVEKQYFSKDSIQKRSIIPFFYSKK